MPMKQKRYAKKDNKKSISKLIDRKLKRRVETKRATQLFTPIFPLTALWQNFSFVDVIGQSLDQRGRVGNQISATSLRFDLMFSIDSFLNANDVIRVVVYYPKIVGNSLPNAGAIYQFIDTDQFVLLYDHRFGVDSTTQFYKHIRKSINLKNRRIDYNDNLGTSIQNNDLTLAFVCQNAGAPPPSVTGTMTLFFTDS